MRHRYLLLTLVVGCVPPSSMAGPASPDPAAKPPGQGWSCYDWTGGFANPNGRQGKCFREQAACEKHRASNKKAAEACSESKQAHCFTAMSEKQGRVVEFCSPRAEACQDSQEFLMKMSGSGLSSVSQCGVWD